MASFLVILLPSLALAALLVPRNGAMEHLTMYALLYALSGILAMGLDEEDSPVSH